MGRWVMILTLPALAPLVREGFFDSHDGVIHVYRLEALAGAVRAGICDCPTPLQSGTSFSILRRLHYLTTSGKYTQVGSEPVPASSTQKPPLSAYRPPSQSAASGWPAVPSSV